jgi:hypothetical protein
VFEAIEAPATIAPTLAAFEELAGLKAAEPALV